jgi:hypothetical protein
VYAGGHPSLLQQDLKIGIAQRPELVDETDAGKELRVPRESLFDSGHADEHHAQAALIEDRAQLLQTVHRQTICFIDNYKGSRIRDSLEPGLVLVERVVVCWLKGQGMVGPVISVIPVLDTPSLVPTAKNIKRRPLFRTCRSLCYAADKGRPYGAVYRSRFRSVGFRKGPLCHSRRQSDCQCGDGCEREVGRSQDFPLS